MASPQLENGFTRIANEIMEALAGIRISGEARQVLDVILRKTYGFQKKEDKIAISQFCLITKMRDSDVCRSIRKLIKMNLISKIANPVANIYRFNKDFTTWKALAKKPMISKIANKDKQKSQFGLAKKQDTKETTKEKKDIVSNDTPFIWENYLEEMSKSPRRDIKLIAFYFKKRGKEFRDKEEVQVAIDRHIKSASKVAKFKDNNVILEAFDKCEKMKDESGQPIDYTFETLIKTLTK